MAGRSQMSKRYCILSRIWISARANILAVKRELSFINRLLLVEYAACQAPAVTWISDTECPGNSSWYCSTFYFEKNKRSNRLNHCSFNLKRSWWFCLFVFVFIKYWTAFYELKQQVPKLCIIFKWKVYIFALNIIYVFISLTDLLLIPLK